MLRKDHYKNDQQHNPKSKALSGYQIDKFFGLRVDFIVLFIINNYLEINHSHYLFPSKIWLFLL
jgi:hypothetical protein